MVVSSIIRRGGRNRHDGWFGVLCACFALFAAFCPPEASAQSFQFRAENTGDVGILTLDWGQPVQATVIGDVGTLRVQVSEPIVGTAADVIDTLGNYVTSISVANGGLELIVGFQRPLEISSGLSGDAVFLQFRPALETSLDGVAMANPIDIDRPGLGNFRLDLPPIPGAEPTQIAPADPATDLQGNESTAPSEAPEPTTAEPTIAEAPPPSVPTRNRGDVRVRAGQHEDYSRIVFDWPSPVGYSVTREGDRVRLRFDRAGDADLAVLDRITLRNIREGRIIGTNPLRVEFSIRSEGEVYHFVSEGSDVAVDVVDTTATRPVVRLATRVADDGAAPVAESTPEESVSSAQAETETEVSETVPEAEPGAESASGDGAEPSPEAVPAAETAPPAEALEDQPPEQLVDAETGLPFPPSPPSRDGPPARPDGPAPPPVAEEEGGAGDGQADIAGEEDQETPRSTAEAAGSDGSDAAGSSPGSDASEGNTPPVETSEATEGAPDAAPVAPVTAETPSEISDGMMDDMEPGMDGTGENPADAEPVQSDENRVAILNPGVESDIAVFARSGVLWVVLAGEDRLDANLAAAQAESGFGPAEIAIARGGIALRFPQMDLVEARVARDGTRWRVEVSSSREAPRDPITLRPQPEWATGARVLADILGTTNIVEIEDPEVGDRLVAVPVDRISRGVDQQRRFAEFQVLRSSVGLAVVPSVDELVVRPVTDGVEITTPQGLALSPSSDVDAAPVSGAPFQSEAGLFDFDAWRGEGAAYLPNRQQLLTDVAAASPELLDRRRLELARFYLARGNAMEARGVLDIVLESQPGLQDQPEIRALRAAIDVLGGEPERGRETLSDPIFDGLREAALWRGLASARMGEWTAAGRSFDAAGPDILEEYPVPYAAPVLLAAAEARARTGEPVEAERLLQTLARRSAGASEALGQVAYLRGVIAQEGGDVPEALELFGQAAAGRDLLASVRARLAALDTNIEAGLISDDEVVEELDGLRFAWRGDDLELDILQRLADQQWRTGRYGAALGTWEDIAEIFFGNPAVAGLETLIDDRFLELFTGDAFEEMGAVQAKAVFDTYRDKLPEGREGDRILERLAQRLAEIDLLPDAAEMMETLVNERLDGTDRVRVGTRLAATRLDDGRPRDALTALAATAVEAEEEGNADRLFDRRLLRAEALAELGQTEVALSALVGETDPRALYAKLDIAYDVNDWELAAETLGELLGPPPPLGAELTGEQVDLVLRRAIALAQAGDQGELDRLAINYGPAMESTPESAVFQLVTREEGQIPSASDLAAIQRGVAEISVFSDFVTELRNSGPGDETS